jgi:hypothetical protein
MAADSAIKPLDCSVSTISFAASMTSLSRDFGRGQRESAEAVYHMYVCPFVCVCVCVCRCGKKCG